MRASSAIWLLFVSVLAIWLAHPALAQDTGKGTKPGVGALSQRRLHRWHAFAKRLQLSDEQQAKIESIRKNAREQARKIRQDSALTPEQKRKQLLELRRSAWQEIGSVLTPEQREKVRKWWAWRWHRWQVWRAHRTGKVAPAFRRSPEQLRTWSEAAKRRWRWNWWRNRFPGSFTP